MLLLFSVNYGVLLLQALLEHWPETHTVTTEDTEQGRANTPGKDINIYSSQNTIKYQYNKLPYPI
jgi:hypothetical protein